jgi:protein deglycase
MSKKVLIILAQGCEELEAVTVSDLLTRAGINVIRAGLDSHYIKCSRGLKIMADVTLNEVFQDALNGEFSAIVLPGGLPGADYLMNDPRVTELLNKQVENQKLTAAICAAPKVLVNAKLHKGKRITCYPSALDALDCSDYTITGECTEIEEHLITSRGPGSSMEFSLAIIDYLEGKIIRDMVDKSLVRC